MSTLIRQRTGLVQDWLADSAAARPHARAVVGDDATFTFGELDALSSRIAQVLTQRGCRRGDRVAILAPTCARSVAAVLGVVKAGAAYVPLDPSGGMVRLADIVRQCEPSALLVLDCEADVLQGLATRGVLRDVEVGWLDDGDAPAGAAFTMDEVRAAEDRAPDVGADPDDIAYVLFTSGTTGSPKGVPIKHASVRAFIEWAVDYFELGPEDRMSGHTALTFDLSTFDVYAALASGAELHQVPKRARMMPQLVARFIQERRLTVWFSVPSQLTYVAHFDALQGVDVSSLRHVAWCGDVLPTRTLRYWKEHLPGVTFSNLYGPTETTVASSFYRVPDDFDDSAADIPIGQACPGEELLVLDEGLEPVPEGEIGELYIRGVGLSPGYWRDPERTAEAFVPDPESGNGSRLYRTGDLARRGADGMVHFIGRSDFQIKAAGYRVEPAEVEHAVLGIAGVKACAVVPVTSSDLSGSEVGCAYVPDGDHPRRTRELRALLKERLPGYMIPSRWLVLDEIPLDARGKVDRSRARTMMGG